MIFGNSLLTTIICIYQEKTNLFRYFFKFPFFKLMNLNLIRQVSQKGCKIMIKIKTICRYKIFIIK